MKRYIIFAVIMGIVITPTVLARHKVDKPSTIISSPKGGKLFKSDKPTTTIPHGAVASSTDFSAAKQDKGGLSVSKPVTPKPQSIPVPPKPTTQVTSSTQIIKNVTFYGWPDNSPPGTAIAYPVIHKQAGGLGTYSDPLTFATASTFPKGTVLYVPYIQKYVIMEDQCGSCSASHIDIWMPSDGNFNKEVLKCENKYTANNKEVILHPASNLPVSPPLFNNGVCA